MNPLEILRSRVSYLEGMLTNDSQRRTCKGIKAMVECLIDRDKPVTPKPPQRLKGKL